MEQTVNLSALPSIVRIYPSNDHNPPHFHVETLDGIKIAKIEITENVPKTFDDLKILKILNQKEFDKIKKNLLRWCNSERNNVKVWQYIKLVWEDNHPNENVTFE